MLEYFSFITIIKIKRWRGRKTFCAFNSLSCLRLVERPFLIRKGIIKAMLMTKRWRVLMSAAGRWCSSLYLLLLFILPSSCVVLLLVRKVKMSRFEFYIYRMVEKSFLILFHFILFSLSSTYSWYKNRSASSWNDSRHVWEQNSCTRCHGTKFKCCKQHFQFFNICHLKVFLLFVHFLLLFALSVNQLNVECEFSAKMDSPT